MFYFWRGATAALVLGFLCQSGRRRPENVSILSSLLVTYRFDVECKRGPAMTSEGLPNLNIDYRFLRAAGLMTNQGQLKDKIGVKSRL